MWNNLEYIASRIQKKVEGGIVTDDSRIDLDVIKDHIHEARAEILGLMKKQTLHLPNVYYQKISCLEVKCEEIVCDGIGSGVYQYYVDMPSSLIGAWGKRSIKRVSNVDGSLKFSWQGAGNTLPFGGNPDATFDIEGKKMILNFNTCKTKFIFIDGLWSDPLKAIGASGCPNWNSEYPIAGDDLGKITDIVFKRMMPQKQVRHDTKNDAQAV